MGAQAQDASADAPSALGDVARQSRKKHAEEHVIAKKVLNEESEDRPMMMVHACQQSSCSSLSITLPRGTNMKMAWTHFQYVAIPLPGHENDKTRAVRFYQADLLNAGDLESAKRLFLQDWFSRPYFFGQAAKFEFDESTRIDGWPATITHFTESNRLVNFRGLGLTAKAPTGTFAFACVYREEDSGDATSVCESVLNTAKIIVPEQYRQYVQPEEPADPSDNPPEENNLQ